MTATQHERMMAELFDPDAMRAHYATALRRWAVTDAIDLIRIGEAERARQRITDSVLGEQARAHGIRGAVAQP